MKKWTWMLLALALATLLPTSGTELGSLHPVSVLLVGTEGKSLRLQTDTQDAGEGETLDAALRNLEATTAGHLFLDTVEQLVLTEQTRYLLPQLKALLRPGVRVCITEDPVNPETLPDFLKIHTPEAKLKDVTKTTPLQKLSCEEGRYFLES